MSNYPVIFSAPQGWGKTRQADALRKQQGCSKVVDNWQPGDPLIQGALHLTNAHPWHFPTMLPAPYRIISRGWMGAVV